MVCILYTLQPLSIPKIVESSIQLLSLAMKGHPKIVMSLDVSIYFPSHHHFHYITNSTISVHAENPTIIVMLQRKVRDKCHSRFLSSYDTILNDRDFPLPLQLCL
ncbi:hypothetical protein VNO77_22834 [Canavalia gladiata]|uniref:Uncharacterized protein n=1 Tax=Canavalia gladiata TaxID=3824 RepID=A0AAN9L5X3_CANGL